MLRKSVLDNGVRIITEQVAAARVTAVGVWVDVGSRDEHDLNNGCAHFVEHMLFKGTSRRSAQQIAVELDVLGGSANAFTSRENTCYYATVLDRHLPQLVDLLADLFLNSLFSNEEIERERQVILQEISMVEDTPDDHIHDLFCTLLWGRHPLGHTVLGSRKVVGAMGHQHLLDYKEHFYTPDKIVITAAGNLDHEQFVAMWRQQGLGALAARPGGRRHERKPPALRAPGRQVFNRPLEQVHMLLGAYGLSAVDEARHALLLANVLLGGNMSSRLFQEIRERHGLAYSVYSYLSPFNDSGYLAIYLGIEPSSVNPALALVGQEINRLCQEPIGPQELANAREYVVGGLYLAAENMEAIMSRLARNELTFGRDITLEAVVEDLNRVTPTQITEVLARLFGRQALSASALGPLTAEEIDWGVLGSAK